MLQLLIQLKMINYKRFALDVNKNHKLILQRGINEVLLNFYMELKVAQLNQLKRLEKLQFEGNKISALIKIEKDLALKREHILSAKQIKTQLGSVQTSYHATLEELLKIERQIPNIPSDKHYDKDIAEPKIIYTSPHKLKSKPKKNYFQFLLENNFLYGSETTRMVGTKFISYAGKAAALLRALSNFMLHVHVSAHKYQEIIPPVLIKNNALYKSGHLPKFANDIFSCSDDLSLIPTSETSLVNLCANKTILEKDLPYKLCAHTTCFRREAGAAGKKNYGLIRLHQFQKVELVQISDPNNSNEDLNTLIKEAEFILKLLDLPYRIVLLPCNDIAFASAVTYDLEVWMPSLQQYVEISSCSNCTDFQAQDIKIKVIYEDKSKKIAHTLNGTGVAIDRVIGALIENHYLNGNVVIPTPLIQFYQNSLLI